MGSTNQRPPKSETGSLAIRPRSRVLTSYTLYATQVYDCIQFHSFTFFTFNWFVFSYNSDDILDEIYPGPIEGVYTPQPMDARITPQSEVVSPVLGRVSSARPKSRLRTSGRPPSRVEVGVQVSSV